MHRNNSPAPEPKQLCAENFSTFKNKGRRAHGSNLGLADTLTCTCLSSPIALPFALALNRISAQPWKPESPPPHSPAPPAGKAWLSTVLELRKEERNPKGSSAQGSSHRQTPQPQPLAPQPEGCVPQRLVLARAPGRRSRWVYLLSASSQPSAAQGLFCL